MATEAECPAASEHFQSIHKKVFWVCSEKRMRFREQRRNADSVASIHVMRVTEATLAERAQALILARPFHFSTAYICQSPGTPLECLGFRGPQSGRPEPALDL